jgi:hypothetical protein
LTATLQLLHAATIGTTVITAAVPLFLLSRLSSAAYTALGALLALSKIV